MGLLVIILTRATIPERWHELAWDEIVVKTVYGLMAGGDQYQVLSREHILGPTLAQVAKYAVESGLVLAQITETQLVVDDGSTQYGAPWPAPWKVVYEITKDTEVRNQICPRSVTSI